MTPRDPLVASVRPLVAEEQPPAAGCTRDSLMHQRRESSFGTSTSLVLLIVWLIVWLIGLGGSAGAQGHGFTEPERAALIAGELVRRDFSRAEAGGVSYGGASWQRVEAPIDEVWRAATDPSALTRLIPSLDVARVVETRDRTRVLYLHHSYGIGEASYYVTMELDPSEHALHFQLDPSRPHDIRGGRGHMRLTPYRGGTIVEWGMLVDPGGGVVMELFGPMLGEWLLLPPRCIRDEVEPGRESSC